MSPLVKGQKINRKPLAKGVIRECRDCGLRQPREDFPKSTVSINGFQSYHSRCTICLSKRRRPYMKKWHKPYYARKKESNRRYQLKRQYGITPEDYDSMFAKQEGQCAICTKTTIKRLAIDHDHSTGKVRKLLCSQCNHALGLAQENPEVLRKMAQYIEEHQEEKCQ